MWMASVIQNVRKSNVINTPDKDQDDPWDPWSGRKTGPTNEMKKINVRKEESINCPDSNILNGVA